MLRQRPDVLRVCCFPTCIPLKDAANIPKNIGSITCKLRIFVHMKFRLQSDYKPSGDQPEAIDQLCNSLDSGVSDITLLGVTGSGKTFTMANVVERLQRPTLVLTHNKTLAAQLYEEFKGFFPDNAVEYFISYYDYYQPEAYVVSSDTFIEKDASINDEIEKLRLHAATSLLTRPDTIVIASVSCIY